MPVKDKLQCSIVGRLFSIALYIFTYLHTSLLTLCYAQFGCNPAIKGPLTLNFTIPCASPQVVPDPPTMKTELGIFKSSR